ncbi:hypothetical protein LCGC14_0466240 [marine sediment metagenome]|uniref:Uncharacterized protein n=1 Tax=marine sediment metagenome TaxID=412755 RepID=A0A0F9SIQ7_9ZZZZ
MSNYTKIFERYVENLQNKVHTSNDIAPVTIIRNHLVTGYKHWEYGGKWLAFLCLDTEIPEEINASKLVHTRFITAVEHEECIGHGDDPNMALYDLYKKVQK